MDELQRRITLGLRFCFAAPKGRALRPLRKPKFRYLKCRAYNGTVKSNMKEYEK